jgi:hypothetical protein
MTLPPTTITSVPIHDFADIFPVVEKAFVEGVCTPSVSLETMGHVRFAKE